ncbi:hypothetical protein HanPI659440_Chr16g0652601 [Helianthus annuus]|nr:hypothetical protein HanHA300_Chr16g0625941 [Helianthus annuus]KAJ0642262.1 hypothetical protein HanLR1_Chr16g0636361 [Helianthus annuus]KAJ0682912.1 hypothetical protein HanPI659440_Chr16g0652601 [Helianthus annuus]
MFYGSSISSNILSSLQTCCIRSLDPRMELFQIQIYSSDTGKWKISVESLSADTSVLLHAVNWNGAVYWASLYGSLLYFKIDVEQLQTLPLPEGLVSSEIMPMCFKESRGHLHLIVYNDLNVSSILERNSLRLSAYVM